MAPDPRRRRDLRHESQKVGLVRLNRHTEARGPSDVNPLDETTHAPVSLAVLRRAPRDRIEVHVMQSPGQRKRPARIASPSTSLRGAAPTRREILRLDPNDCPDSAKPVRPRP
jgi:hypothetical protein